MATQPLLTSLDVGLMQAIARDLSNQQIEADFKMTPGERVYRMQSLFRKVGVSELGYKSRAVAVAVAIKQHQLPEPPELQVAINMLKFGLVVLDAVDLQILQMVAEGYYEAEILEEVGLGQNELPRRLKDVTGRLALPLRRRGHLGLSAAAAAIWAGLLTDLALDNSRPLLPDEVSLLTEIALELEKTEIGQRRGVSKGNAEGRVTSLKSRLGARTEAQAVDICIRKGWLPPPAADFHPEAQRILDAIEIAKRKKFTARELRAVDLLGQGYKWGQIYREIGGDLGRLADRMYRRVHVGSSAAMVAVVRWAGNPKKPQRRAKKVLYFNDYELLVALVEGLWPGEISKLAGRNVSGDFTALYVSLRANGARQAVAIAAATGLLDAYFATEDLNSVRADMFPQWYVRGLQLLAQGKQVRGNTDLGAASARSFHRYAAYYKAEGIPKTKAIAFLVKRKEITLK